MCAEIPLTTQPFMGQHLTPQYDHATQHDIHSQYFSLPSRTTHQPSQLYMTVQEGFKELLVQTT